MKSLTQRASLVALMCLCTQAALAKASAEISIQDLRFDLVDLTPDDGLAPGMLMPEDEKAYTGGFVYIDDANYQEGYSAFLRPFTLDIHQPEGHVFLQVSPSMILARSETDTSSDVNGALNLYTGNSFITLLPYSALHITGLVSSRVESDGARFGSMTSAGSVSLGLQFVGTASGGGQVLVDLNTHAYALPEVLTEQKPIDFLLQNDSDASRTVEMYTTMVAYTHVVPYVPAVPEPGAWALVLCGLITVGGRLRARRSS